MFKKRTCEKLEKRVRELENRLQEEQNVLEILEYAPKAVFLLDRAGKVLFANRLGAKHLEKEPREIMGMTLRHHFPPDIAEKRRLKGIEALKTGRSQTLEDLVAGRWYDSTFVPIGDKNGNHTQLAIYSEDVTDRKLSEKRLKDSEEKYRAVFENSLAAIILSNGDGAVFSANEAACRMFGMSESEIISRGRNKIANLKDPRLAAALKERSKTGKFKGELTCVRKDGSIFPVDLSSVVFKDSYENEKICIIAHDITERKKAEGALRESENRYRQLFENSTDFVFTLDLQGNFTDVNKASEDLTGYTKNELIGMNYRDYTPEHSHGLISEAFQRILTQREPLKDFPLEVIIKDGTKRYFETCASPLWKGDHVIGFQGSSRDITRRMKSEEERNSLQVQLSNAIEMANLGHWEYDVIADLFTFNDHFYKIFGTTVEEIGGYAMSSSEYARRFVHPEDRTVVEAEIRKAIESTDPRFSRQLEHRMLYADGTVGFVAVRFFIVKDAQGNTIKTYGVNQDITARKRMEEEILKSEKLESLGVLAGGLAHDFNNILATILGNVSLAKYQASPEGEIVKLLSDVEKASKRAQALTNQLLTFSKGGAPVKETASLENIIRESSLFVTSGSKSVCKFSIAKDLWPVEIDVGQISQVINNIVINANQAMPEGGTIEIMGENLIIDEGSERQLRPGKYIRISFRDEGTGIPEKYVSKIFDPYFTTKHAGSGLGLATTYSIINRHGGIITVQSRFEVGTVFHIYLPASEGEIPEKEEDKLTAGKGKILVMDDEAPLRRMLGKVLSQLGYTAEFAEGGVEAIRMVRAAKDAKKPYDAVILDLTIPGGMGGKEAIKKLMEIDPEIRAIVSSGYSDDPVMADFRNYGFKGRLAKPFQFGTLSEVLREVIRDK